MKTERNELGTICHGLKMLATDGKLTENRGQKIIGQTIKVLEFTINIKKILSLPQRIGCIRMQIYHCKVVT